MKVLLLVIAAVTELLMGNSSFAQTYCDRMSALTGFTTQAQVIPAPGVGNARILVCGYTASAASASVVTFQTGTGSNCATGSAAIGPTVQLGTTSTVVEAPGNWQGWAGPAGAALCVTGTTSANITLYWTTR